MTDAMFYFIYLFNSIKEDKHITPEIAKEVRSLDGDVYFKSMHKTKMDFQVAWNDIKSVSLLDMESGKTVMVLQKLNDELGGE